MSAVDFTRFSLPLVLVVFYALGMWFPSTRLRRRTGRSAMVVHQAANPFQQLMAVALATYTVGLFAWTALYACLGPNTLGVWQVPEVVLWAGWTVMVLGFALIVVAQAHMGASWRIGIDRERTALVTGGLFNVVRNPIFSGMQLMLMGVVLLSPSAWTVMGGLYGAFIFALQARLEEQHLLKLHRQAYADYAARTGRFIPNLGRLRVVEPSATGQG